MSLDDLIEQAAQKDLPWDDLRERRALADFRRKRASGYQVEDETPSRRRTNILLGSGMVATAAAVILTVMSTANLREPDVASAAGEQVAAFSANHVAPTQSHQDQASDDETGSAVPSPETAAPTFASQMQLADGSIARLGPGARVTLGTQSDALISLDQGEGLVRYEVVPDLPRRFQVIAAGVKVDVVGTVFDIEVSETFVSVAVTRGKVLVGAGDRQAELGAGDNLQIKLPLASAADADADASASDADDSTAGSTTEPKRNEPTPSVDTLLDRVDAARARGDQATAAKVLREMLNAYPSDPRAASAWFTLAKVEKSRGRLVQAAKAFERAHQKAPNGPLSEDALAESARAWHDVGKAEEAQRVAAKYLARYANGTHRARMAKIAGE